MSTPNIPNIKPEIDLSIHDTINLLLASIALEEISLSHIMNAEAEKIQEVIKFKCNSLEDLLEIDRSVESMLRTIIQKEFLLQTKFENVLKLIETTRYCKYKPVYKKEEEY
ncbi:MAG: hypothetical protein GX995_10805 [Clostridiales bacterium]|jgi:hypothetical protein|nr:hypothetical protein [Clostridiales bacterium]